jgi:ABC-type amino acid transport substrate-binding protein
VIAVLLIVMLMTTALSMSLLAMAIRAKAAEKTVLLPLSVSITLIFGLPALRNIQPGVPPVGALVDYVTFICAELIVAASAVMIVWTWLLRTRPKS